MSDSQPTVSRNTRSDRYEILVDGARVGFARYTDTEDGRRVFFHTEVDPSHAGGGLAGVLLDRALSDTRAAGLRIVPVCPYVARFVRSRRSLDAVVEPVTPEALTAVRTAMNT